MIQLISANLSLGQVAINLCKRLFYARHVKIERSCGERLPLFYESRQALDPGLQSRMYSYQVLTGTVSQIIGYFLDGTHIPFNFINWNLSFAILQTQ